MKETKSSLSGTYREHLNFLDNACAAVQRRRLVDRLQTDEVVKISSAIRKDNVACFYIHAICTQIISE